MHYGGSTLDNRSERFILAARLLNELERVKAATGGLTPYQQSIRFWATAKIRLADHREGKEVHHGLS